MNRTLHLLEIKQTELKVTAMKEEWSKVESHVADTKRRLDSSVQKLIARKSNTMNLYPPS